MQHRGGSVSGILGPDARSPRPPTPEACRIVVALAFSVIRYASHAIVPLPDADAVTFIAVPVVLVTMVLLACILPARRAARVDPLVVLRNS